MSFWIITGICFVVIGGGVALFFFVKKYQTLRVLDLDSSRSLREKKLRDRIMEDRMQRAVLGYAGKIAHVMVIPWRVLQHMFQRLAGKFIALERRYHREHTAKEHISPENLQSLLADAERALREERFQVAEERLVELISAESKFAPAYEALSRVYAAKREWKEAIESLVYYVKLEPTDGDRRLLLGAMHEREGNRDAAFAEYMHALDISPRNPKYLDAAITLACELKRFNEAQIMLEALKEANPDNTKKEVFADMLAHSIPEQESDTEQSSPKKKKRTPLS